MRKLFVDKWNSFWHFAFGALATQEPLIIPCFVIYQLVTSDDNVIVDLTEFGIGMGAAKIINDRA